MTSEGCRVDSLREFRHRLRVSLPSRMGIITEMFNHSSDKSFPHFGKTYVLLTPLSSEFGELRVNTFVQERNTFQFGFGLTMVTSAFILENLITGQCHEKKRYKKIKLDSCRSREHFQIYLSAGNVVLGPLAPAFCFLVDTDAMGPPLSLLFPQMGGMGFNRDDGKFLYPAGK